MFLSTSPKSQKYIMLCCYVDMFYYFLPLRAILKMGLQGIVTPSLCKQNKGQFKKNNTCVE